MGCVQSQQYSGRAMEASKSAKLPDKATGTPVGGEGAPCGESREEAGGTGGRFGAGETGSLHSRTGGWRDETAVRKMADAFDRADAASRQEPALDGLHEVRWGLYNQKLCASFERRQHDAGQLPPKRDGRLPDIRASKLFTVVQAFEQKEQEARAEPRLRKTFSQRLRERELAAAAVDAL